MRVIFLLCIIFAGLPAFSLPFVSSVLPVQEQKYQKGIQGSFEFENMYYPLNSIRSHFGDHSLGTLWLKGKNSNHGGVFVYDLSASYDIYTSSSKQSSQTDLRLNLSEIFYKYDLSQNLQISGGVINDEIFLIDTVWDTSFWQRPFYQNWSGLDDKHLGNIALALDWKAHSQVSLKAYIMPAFLPNLGESFNLVEGEIISPSPWFNAPPNQIVQNGVPVRIHHDLSIPSTSDFFLKKIGYGFSATLEPQSHISVTVSYLDKMSSRETFVLSEDAFIKSVGTEKLRAFLKHSVVYLKEQVYNVDVSLTQGNWRTVFSGSYSDIEHFSESAKYSKIVHDTIFSSLYLSYNKKIWNAYISTLASSPIKGTQGKTTSILGFDFQEHFSNSYKHLSGIRAGGAYKVSAFSRQFLLSADRLESNSTQRLSFGVSHTIKDWGIALRRGSIKREKGLIRKNNFWSLGASTHF